MHTCNAYCLANTFNFQELITAFPKQSHIKQQQHVLHVVQTNGEVTIFDFGVVVIWSLNPNNP